MVRADKIDVALPHRAKQRGPVRSLAQRRRHDEFLRVRVEIPFVRERQVLRTGLEVHLLPAFARAQCFDEPLLRGQVHDPYRRVREICDAHEPRDGLRLHIRGPRNRVRRGAEKARGLALRNAGLQYVVVLAVYADDAVLGRRELERSVDAAVVDAHGVVDHVHLKRRDAVIDHPVHLRGARVVPLGHGHVEAVVTRRALRFFVPKLQRVEHRHAAVLRRKVEHGGRAAEHGGLTARIEVVRRYGHAEVEIEVRVRVDKPREHIAAGGIDRFVGVCCDIRLHAHDDAVLGQHVRDKGAVGVYDRAAMDQSFHNRFLSRFSLLKILA